MTLQLRLLRRWRIAPLLTATMAGAVAVAIALVTVLDTLRQRDSLERQLEEKGLLIARTLGDVFADALYSSDVERLRYLADLLGEQAEVAELEVFAADGRIVVGSNHPPFPTGSVSEEVLALAATSPRGAVYRGNGGIEVVQGISSGERRLGGVRIRLETAAIAAEIRRMVRGHVWQGLLAIGIGVALSSWVARFLVVPVRRLTEATERVAAGDLSFTAEAGRRDEIGDLARGFEQMTERLSEAVREREAERTARLTELNERLTAEVAERGRAQRLAEETNEKLEAQLAWRVKSEAEREGIIAELEGKNAELERFIYTVSHDLKSPLVTIRGFLGLARKDADPDRLERDLERIDAAAARMQSLLDELLELSRVGRVVSEVERVPLSELVEEALRLAEGELQRRGIRVAVDPELPVVSGDRSRLLEVLQNLIGNAVKFMGEQSDPLIEIGCRELNEGRATFVRDNGVGIEPHYREKVFELFERLDGGVEGTGVGLAISKRIVELHGGRIWVESEGRGRGSTFFFVLPEPPPEVPQGT